MLRVGSHRRRAGDRGRLRRAPDQARADAAERDVQRHDRSVRRQRRARARRRHRQGDRGEADRETVRVDMEFPHGTEIPANADAAIMQSSLVTDRFVELTPAYRSGRQIAQRHPAAAQPDAQPREHRRDGPRRRRPHRRPRRPAWRWQRRRQAARRRREEPLRSGPLHPAGAARQPGRDGRDQRQRARPREDHHQPRLPRGRARRAGHPDPSPVHQRHPVDLDARGPAGPAPVAGLASWPAGDHRDDVRTRNRGDLKTTLGRSRSVLSTLAANQKDMADTLDLLPLVGQNIWQAYDPKTKRIRIRIDMRNTGPLSATARSQICRRSACPSATRSPTPTRPARSTRCSRSCPTSSPPASRG